MSLFPKFLLDDCAEELFKRPEISASLAMRAKLAKRIADADPYLLDPFSPIYYQAYEGEIDGWLCDGDDCSPYLFELRMNVLWKTPKVITAKFGDYISVDWMPNDPRSARYALKAMAARGLEVLELLSKFRRGSKMIGFKGKCALVKALAGRNAL
ncbi:MAG: hypothetical protein ACP5MH_12135 [Thermoproteus sp.]